MNNKTLVTGGAGFIGSNLVDALIARGDSVIIIDNLSGGKKENINPKADFYEKDLRNYNEIAPLFKGIDYVFHLAAQPRVQVSIERPAETHDNNVNTTLNVLLAAKETGVKKLIYSASSSAYGDQKEMPLIETMKTAPMSPYGLQKYIGEEYARVFSLVYKLKTVSLRYFNVYGPRMSNKGDYANVIGKFLKQKQEGKALTITGDGEQTRDFTHVFDVVRANILASESYKTGNGEIINIGAGSNASVNKISKLIGGEIKYIEARLEPHDTLSDNRKAFELLNWKPEISLEKGISDLLK
ncbi:MAG: NAD-dependent epimerase/dehydratase family protein [Patescibacteria group bacterium]